MFENRIKQISKEIFGDECPVEYFILTREKNKREHYIKKENKAAIEFIKPKYTTKTKKNIYLGLKLGLAQLFLKKIKLSAKFGDVIFVGGQIKAFDLTRKRVTSFTLKKESKNSFLKSKFYQKEMHEFSPEIFEINSSNPYCIEELLSTTFEESDIAIFKRLFQYYRCVGTKKIAACQFFADWDYKRLHDDLFLKLLKKYQKQTFIFTKVHGDFAREQCLKKNDKIIFFDWNPYEALIIADLVNYFRNETDFLNNPLFLKILKLYPTEVQKNIKEYLILNELHMILRNPKRVSLAKKRLKNLI